MQSTPISAAAALASVLVILLASGAAVQGADLAPFVAHADITVDNSSPVPQIVAGTNVAPFELPPHQQAKLAMSIVPPPTAPGSPTPVRFFYSIGETPGPQCRGAINMRVSVSGTATGSNEATNCVANSLSTGGANCKIAVSARNSICQGGLAFDAQ
jgi:hypothetical protein